MKDKHLIELIDVSKAYGGDVALSHVDLYIKDGEFLTLLGPSGCGKTTMLRLIAGFIMPDSGRIEMDGTDIANTPPSATPPCQRMSKSMQISADSSSVTTTCRAPSPKTMRFIADFLEKK